MHIRLITTLDRFRRELLNFVSNVPFASRALLLHPLGAIRLDRTAYLDFESSFFFDHNM
jgi:hypothetical protein